jgi:autotransporter strand-loop-strand O-heptosyltransferase
MKEILTKIYNLKSSRSPKETKKIKLIHLLTLPEEEREKKSIEDLSKLSRFGITYIQHINEPYTELPPKDSCRYPDRVGMNPGYYIKTPGVYGCYLAHKNAVLKEFDDDVDFLLVCECDCVMSIKPRKFYNELLKICNTLEKENDIVYVNLGSDAKAWERSVKETINDSLSIVDRTVLTDCLLYQKSSIDIVKEKFLNEKWDGVDLWQQEVFINHRKAYSKIPMATQLKGGSLIERTKDSSFKVSYCSGVTCKILGEKSDSKYNIKFTDTKTNKLIHSDTIPVNHWVAPFRKWYTKWRITVTEEVSQKEIFSEELDLKGKKVLISFESSSLGDNIAWIPYVEEFRKEHDCEVSCSTFFNNLFEKEYPKIEFVSVGSSLENIYASYEIGWFDNWDNKEKNPNSVKTIPLQQTASDILGLKYEEIKTKINIESPDRPIEEKYVCISTSSTAGCKHWHGWQEVVDYLNSKGYKVVVIQKEPLDYMDLDSLENIIHPDTKNIQEAITWLYNCDFFIGISSGISWLAWALNKEVVLISGFTDIFHEFSTPYRIINKDVCNSCWHNKNFLFDKGDWNWCPIHKNTEKQFECSKSITFDMAKEEIDKLLR